MHPAILLLSEQYRASASLRTRKADSSQSVHRHGLGILLTAIAITAGILAAVIHAEETTDLRPGVESSLSIRSLSRNGSWELDRQLLHDEPQVALCRRFRGQGNESRRAARRVRSEQRCIFRLLRGSGKRVHQRPCDTEVNVGVGELQSSSDEPPAPRLPD